MPDWSGATPREIAALDQFAAAFRDAREQLCVSLRRTGEALAAMAESFGQFAEELRVTALQLAVEDTEAMSAHPDLARADGYLDEYWAP